MISGRRGPALRPLISIAAWVMASAVARGAPQIDAAAADTILVKGAWSSADGSASVLPEDGTVSRGHYANGYFGLNYSFDRAWNQKYEGPPPSASGYYILAQLESMAPASASARDHVLIAAQDLFFTTLPARNALELISYYQQHLSAEYLVDRAAGKQRIANRDYVRLDYFSPLAGLHWQVLATEIRCHVVQFIFTSRSARSIEPLIEQAQPDADAPVCIKDFANRDTVLAREDPMFSQSNFNPIPVRIIIDKDGKVKHIHFLSAFPEQAKRICDALLQWRFKPYLLDGQPTDVETGLMFGRAPHTSASAPR